MESIDLLTVCISAFIAVFGLLTILALIMRLILVAFPEREIPQPAVAATDGAVIAAVTTVISNLYPGTKISKVEEVE